MNAIIYETGKHQLQALHVKEGTTDKYLDAVWRQRDAQAAVKPSTKEAWPLTLLPHTKGDPEAGIVIDMTGMLRRNHNSKPKENYND